MTSIRCHAGCGTFYDKNEKTCPKCGTAKRPVNVALDSQVWRSNLNANAAHAAKYA